MHVTKHVREWLELDDRLEKILTAHVHTTVDSASVPCWRTMRYKDVDVIGDQIPLFLQLGPSREIESPVAKLGLPGRSPDTPSIDYML